MTIIDLTHPLNQDTPVYPGDPEVKIEEAASLAKDGYHDFKCTLGTHVGTHIDGPLHMLAEGKLISEHNLVNFIANGLVVDARSGYQDIDVSSLDLNEVEAILFHTGIDRKYSDADYYDSHDAINLELITKLIEKGVRIFGFDCGSPDYSPFNSHKAILANNGYIIENMTNLDRLIGKSFILHAAPLKLAADSAQTRAYAVVKE